MQLATGEGGAASEVAVVAAAADKKRAAEGRAASMRRCVLQLEEITLRSRPSGVWRQLLLECHGHMEYYYEQHFFRTWHAKYLFERYGNFEYKCLLWHLTLMSCLLISSRISLWSFCRKMRFTTPSMYGLALAVSTACCVSLINPFLRAFMHFE